MPLHAFAESIPPRLRAGISVLTLALFTASAVAADGDGAAPVVAPEGALNLPSVGLSSVRSQRFPNLDFGLFRAEPFDLFGEVLATGDFNGDGADDLAAGSPDDDGLFASTPDDAGSVTIRYGAKVLAGTVGGLHGGPPDAVLLQSTALDSPEAEDHFGRGLAACDFNHDGFDDLAIGIPDEDILGDTNAGAVEIHHGSASGLLAVAAKMFLQESAGFPVLPGVPKQFGFVLACGDFDGDGFDDLAIGSPNSSPSASLSSAGVVFVAVGSAAGLVTTGSYVLHEDTPSMPGISEDFDQFGFSLAAGNFNGDGFMDLAIGSPGETIANLAQSGAMHMLLGAVGGLLPGNSAFFGETSLGGASEEGDQFAYALATGDFDGEGLDDLAIGVPTETFGAVESVGQVVVLYGQVAIPGLDLTRPEFFDQENVLGPGNADPADFFGQALAAGDFDGDGNVDLAIGHPEEDILNAEDGAVTVMMGSRLGFRRELHRMLGGGLEGFPGDSHEGDRTFGNAMATGDFDGDGHDDLAISSPREDVTTAAAVSDAGAITVLYGSIYADGFNGQSIGYWSATAQ